MVAVKYGVDASLISDIEKNKSKINRFVLFLVSANLLLWFSVYVVTLQVVSKHQVEKLSENQNILLQQEIYATVTANILRGKVLDNLF